jgi:Zn-dependent protease with chaperone function
MLAKRTKKLYEIDPRSWEHPADTAALSAVRQLKGFDELLKFILSLTSERAIRLVVLASSVKVTERQFPRLNAIRDNVVDVFDWKTKPDVFVTQSPYLNAGVLGVDQPFIIVNSSLARSLDDAELTAVIGHEMGHIMSGHALYKTMTWLLANITLSAIPVAQIVVYAILAALSEWDRKSELTADRAGLLAVQAVDPAYTLLMKLAGGDDMSQLNIDEFFAQAQEYENHKSLLDSIHKILNQLWMSHPYPVIRLQEIRTWALSGTYETILGGTYLRRGYYQSTAQDDMKAGFDHYRQAAREADDPISKFVSGVGDSIEEAAGEIGKTLKGFLGE